MVDELNRAIGRLEGKVDSLDERLKLMDGKLEGVVTLAHQARGGFRTLLAVGSIAGVIGSAITTLFVKMKGGQ